MKLPKVREEKMNFDYRIYRRGAYWLVIITTDMSNDIYIMVYLKGAVFSVVDSLSETIKSNENNYQTRITESLIASVKTKIFESNNYAKALNEVDVKIEDTPRRLVQKIIKYLDEKNNN